MLMGAAHNALWAFNARVSLTLPVCHRPQAATLTLRPGAVRSPVTVVPSCGLETRSWRTGRMARHKQECIRLPYTAALASPPRLPFARGGAPPRKGEHAAPHSRISSGQKSRMAIISFVSSFAAQFFIHIGIRAAMDVIACPGGKRCYVAGIVADHRVYRVRLSRTAAAMIG